MVIAAAQRRRRRPKRHAAADQNVTPPPTEVKGPNAADEVYSVGADVYSPRHIVGILFEPQQRYRDIVMAVPAISRS
jgi:hypothetical protein